MKRKRNNLRKLCLLPRKRKNKERKKKKCKSKLKLKKKSNKNQLFLIFPRNLSQGKAPLKYCRRCSKSQNLKKFLQMSPKRRSNKVDKKVNLFFQDQKMNHFPPKKNSNLALQRRKKLNKDTIQLVPSEN